MENKRVKKVTKTRLKGEVRGFLFAWFLVWLILSSIFLVKIVPASINVLILQDNRQFIEESYKPTDLEARDEAYTQLVDYNNSLINSDDAMISFFFSKTIIVKLVLFFIALAPYFIIIKWMIDASDRRNAKKQQSLKRRANQPVKAAR